MQYKAGDLLTASAASASYNQAQWTKQVRFVDDNLKIGGVNLLAGVEKGKWDIATGLRANSTAHVRSQKIKTKEGKYIFSSGSGDNIKAIVLKYNSGGAYTGSDSYTLNSSALVEITLGSAVKEITINFSRPDESSKFNVGIFGASFVTIRIRNESYRV